MTQQRYKLEQLAELTGITERTIHDYKQRGLLHRPNGGRRHAYYDNSHLETLLEIKRLRTKGLPLERIADVLHHGADAEQAPAVQIVKRLRVADGVQLEVDVSQCDLQPQQLSRLLQLLPLALEQARSIPTPKPSRQGEPTNTL